MNFTLKINIKKSIKKIEYIFIIIIVLVFLGIGLIIYSKKDNTGSFPISYAKSSSSQEKVANILVVDNINLVKLENKNIGLKNDWHINQLIRGTQDDNLKCDPPYKDSCLIYEISNGKTVFYLSNLSPLKSSSVNFITTEMKKLKVLGNTSDFVYEKFNVNTINSSSKIPVKSNLNIYKQVYGKISEGIYASTGSLPLDESFNKDKLNNFEFFLQSLIYN